MSDAAFPRDPDPELKTGEDGVSAEVRTATCTCGRGDDAPAICHAEDCPCVDWVAGELEGGLRELPTRREMGVDAPDFGEPLG